MANGENPARAAAGGLAPLDLAHLQRQTLGDEHLRRDVLTLFAEQAAATRASLAAADADERRRLAHRLSGAARAVGAFPLAEGAAELEASPSSEAASRQLLERIEEVTAFIAERMP